jgi:hypothetical protein
MWVNISTGVLRILEPIALSTIDNERFAGTGTWNPLRTGATFFAPLEGGGVSTTIYLVCPNRNIQSPTGGALSPANGFPLMDPPFRESGATTPLRIRVYDDEEVFLRDVTSNCECLTARPVTAFSNVYADAVLAPFGTYTEVEGSGTVTVSPAVCDAATSEPLLNPPAANPGNSCPLIGTPPTHQQRQIAPAVTEARTFAFTGYRAIDYGGVDIWGRLNNGWRCDLAPGTCTTPSNGR